MLGWLRHKATPTADGTSTDSNDPRHHAEERLGKLLDRLGNESHTTATIVEVREIVASEATQPSSEKVVDRAPPPTDGRQDYVDGVDPEDYREALPLLRRAMAAVGGRPEDDSEMLAAKIVGALRERHGFTPDLLSDIGPYLEQFVRDVHAGAVQLDAEDAPADGGGPVTADRAADGAAEIAGPPAGESTSDHEPAAEAVVEIPSPRTSESITPDATTPEEAHEIAPPLKAARRTRKGRSGDAETVGEATGGSPGMRVIAVCSQKGGAGKTTIAAHLAVRAGETGHGPAVLIDTDPQGSLGEWWRARHADSPALAKVKLEDLAANLAELRSYGTAIAIIDTPPALTGSIEQVIALADLVVIPARPSPHDLRAVGATVEMARRAGKPFLFVVNGAAPRASITAQAVAALSEHGRVVPVILYQRTDWAASMIDGRTVMETAAAGNSAQEIGRLWDYIYEQISMRAAA
jgi:chromosome partitioning protein